MSTPSRKKIIHTILNNKYVLKCRDAVRPSRHISSCKIILDDTVPRTSSYRFGLFIRHLLQVLIVLDVTAPLVRFCVLGHCSSSRNITKNLFRTIKIQRVSIKIDTPFWNSIESYIYCLKKECVRRILIHTKDRFPFRDLTENSAEIFVCACTHVIF